MDFREEAVLPVPPARVWAVLVDFRRVSECVPGCESVEEVEPLARYRAVLKQRLGPFRLEVPVDIHVEDVREPEHLGARVTGRDRITGASVSARLAVDVAPDGPSGSRLATAVALTVAGRLAALGYPIMKRRAEEIFAEFTQRLRAALESA